MGQVYTFGSTKGTHLPFGANAVQEIITEEAIPADPVVEEVVEALPWGVASQGVFSESLHVNLRELDAVLDVATKAFSLSLEHHFKCMVS